MKKKIVIILSILLGLLVVIGIVLASVTIIDKTNQDKKEQEKKENEIISSFDSFKEAIEEFNIEWSTYNTVIKDDINKNTVYQYDGWILSLDTYTEAIDKVEENSKVLKKYCVNGYYSKQEVNNKCEAFIDAYEKAINSYVEDINDFNMKIEEINDKDKKELKEYECKYKLVDLNKDNTFDKIVLNIDK